VENMFFVEDWSHSMIGIRVKVEIVRVRDPNSICPSPKASRCDICDIFVIGRNFEICDRSGGIGPIGPIPKPTTDLVGGAGAEPPGYGPVLLGRFFRTVFIRTHMYFRVLGILYILGLAV
ncbi:hypothetical protein TorRG33x02_280300, partial [Trema orientale]